MNTVFYQIAPSVKLMPYIQSYWLGNFNVQSKKDYSQSVLPNGCVELIIHITNDHCFLNKGNSNWSKTPEFIMVGLYDKPYEVQFLQNVQVFGIRFYPDGIRNIFGIAPAEFKATYQDSTDVVGRMLQEFCLKVKSLHSFEEQAQLANKFVENQLASNKQSHDYTHEAMRLIRQVQGMSDYQKLTQQVPISLRQLQREFKALYGITVKDYMRLARISAIQNYMLTKKQGLTELSYNLNFSDQSHFIREFKTFMGITPKKFSKKQEDFIINPIQNLNRKL